MIIEYIKPDSNCKECHGDGETFQSHPWGATSAQESLLCVCVEEQIKHDNSWIEIVKTFQLIAFALIHMLI